jgi:hypothetical protein
MESLPTQTSTKKKVEYHKICICFEKVRIMTINNKNNEFSALPLSEVRELIHKQMKTIPFLFYHPKNRRTVHTSDEEKFVAQELTDLYVPEPRDEALGEDEQP